MTTIVRRNGKRIQGQTTSIRRVGFGEKIQRPKGQNLRKEERRIPEERERKGEREEEIIIILPFGGKRGGSAEKAKWRRRKMTNSARGGFTSGARGRVYHFSALEEAGKTLGNNGRWHGIQTLL